jgi:hypothetical protein
MEVTSEARLESIYWSSKDCMQWLIDDRYSVLRFCCMAGMEEKGEGEMAWPKRYNVRLLEVRLIFWRFPTALIICPCFFRWESAIPV